MSEIDDIRESVGLAGELAALEESKRLAAEFDRRVWRASEALELLERFGTQGAEGTERTKALMKAIDKAMAEGRFIDNEAPTVANLRERLGPDAWILSAAENTLAFRLSSYLDGLDRKAQTPGQRVPIEWGIAQSKFTQWIVDEGGFAAADDAFGLLYAGGLPEWIPDVAVLGSGQGYIMQVEYERIVDTGQETADISRFVRGGPPGDAARVKARLEVVGQTWRLIWSRMRAGEKLPPRFRQLPGMSFQPYLPGNSSFSPTQYARETAQAAEALRRVLPMAGSEVGSA